MVERTVRESLLSTSSSGLIGAAEPHSVEVFRRESVFNIIIICYWHNAAMNVARGQIDAP